MINILRCQQIKFSAEFVVDSSSSAIMCLCCWIRMA